MTLDEALDHVQIEDNPYCDDESCASFPFAVSTGHRQIVALFEREVDACRFRLSYINGMLNPVEGEG